MLPNIDRQILKIAIPSIVTNITIPLLGIIDVTIVGHLGSPLYIGALAVGSMMFNVIYWIFGFLRMGTSGLTSQAYGRHDVAEIRKTLFRSLFIGVTIGLLLVATQYLVREIGLYLMRPTTDIIPYTTIYFNICIWGAPAVLGLYSLTGWYIGMQTTKIPMYISIIQNIINICASIYFVFILHMKVEGIALGTLIAQYCGFILALILLSKILRMRNKEFPTPLSNIEDKNNPNSKLTQTNFFILNLNLFLRTLFIVAVNMFFTSAGAAQGSVILAVNTLLFQLFTLYSFIMDGFAYAGEAIGGKYYGARNAQMFHLTKNHLFLWGFALTVLYTLVYYFGGQHFLHILTNESKLISAALPYLPWAIAIPIAGIGAFIWDGLFIGMTATRGMLLSSAIAAISFFFLWYLLSPTIANHALWLALIIYLLMRAIVQTIIFKISTKSL